MKCISAEGSRLLKDWEASKDKNNDMSWCVAETCADIIKRIDALERKGEDASPPGDLHAATIATQTLVHELLVRDRELAEARADAEWQASQRRWLRDSMASLADKLSAALCEAREALAKQAQK